jgi:methylated-DNA-[protein]-cysteine S-methyltransferase
MTQAIEMQERKRRLIERARESGLLDVAYASAETPLGPVLVAATEGGLVRVGLPNQEPDSVLEELAARISPRVLEDPARLDEARRELEEYFEGRRRSFDLAVDWQLARGFRRRVLRELAGIPYGETRTYAEIAARAGSPRAHRAAGSACGTNPVPLVIPCHRVVRSGGQIGNYGGGPEMKEYLLRLEHALPEAASARR